MSDINTNIYEEINYYMFFLKHLIKLNGLWKIFCLIGCMEWDCYPEDLEEDLLFEGLFAVGVNLL